MCVCAFDVVKSSLKVVQFEGMTFCQRFQKYLDSTTSPSLTHTHIYNGNTQWKKNETQEGSQNQLAVNIYYHGCQTACSPGEININAHCIRAP